MLRGRRRALAAGCGAALFALLLCGGAQQGHAQVKQAEIVQAVTDAFKTFEAIECTDLKFDIQPVLTTLPQPVEMDGGILVALFGYGDAWTHSNLAYFTVDEYGTVAAGDLKKATLKINARDWPWTIGAQKNKIDLQTSVLHMIPFTLGYYVGTKPKSLSLEAFIKYNYIEHTLLPEHETAAQFLYPKTDVTCTKPAEPVMCSDVQGPVAPDAGFADDAGANPMIGCLEPYDKANKGVPISWKTQPIKVYIYVPADGQLPGGSPPPVGDGGVVKKDGGTTKQDGSTPAGDGGVKDGPKGAPCTTTAQCAADEICSAEGTCVKIGGGSDDGCCRVAHTTEENVTYTLLLLVGLGLLIWRRRRR